MRHRLRILIDFYSSFSALLFLAGLGFLFLRLVSIGPDAVTAVLALVGIATGLPLRVHSLTTGLHTLLEEERQITHQRLAKLEVDELGSDKTDKT